MRPYVAEGSCPEELTQMHCTSFRYSNPFSSIDVKAAYAENAWLEWTPADDCQL